MTFEHEDSAGRKGDLHGTPGSGIEHDLEPEPECPICQDSSPGMPRQKRAVLITCRPPDEPRNRHRATPDRTREPCRVPPLARGFREAGRISGTHNRDSRSPNLQAAGLVFRQAEKFFTMNALTETHPLTIVAFASPVYWPDRTATEAAASRILAELKSIIAPVGVDFVLVTEAAAVRPLQEKLKGATAVLLPLSGAVQPWMLSLAGQLGHAALANAYLPGFLPPELAAQLLERNAHPACTDFYAHRRLAGSTAPWLGSPKELSAFARANAAVGSLKSARFLKIGETEPWVINSAREPSRFLSALGCEVIPLAAEVLYQEYARVEDSAAEAAARDWIKRAEKMEGPALPDVLKAVRVTVAMRRLLAAHKADALSMACFSMIGVLDTTSCLALSALNDSADAIGACEGDLDAAVTLFLLKALGADFVWIANPIIHEGGVIDLAHCTAPRCACGSELNYRLRRHHESGKGVAPEVDLPGDRAITLTRIGANLTELCVHPGRTARVSHQPTCHTQVRVRLSSTRRFLETLNGTHVVLSYGEHQAALAYCAQLLGLKLTGTIGEQSEAAVPEPLTLPVCQSCSPAPRS